MSINLGPPSPRLFRTSKKKLLFFFWGGADFLDVLRGKTKKIPTFADRELTLPFLRTFLPKVCILNAFPK